MLQYALFPKYFTIDRSPVETIYSAYHQVRCLLSHYWQKSNGDNLQCLPSSPLSTISLLTEVQWRQFTVLTIKSAVYYLTIDRSPVETIYSAYHQVRCLLSHYWQKSSGDNLQCLPSSPLSTISLLTEVQWRQFTVLTIKSAVYYLTIDRSPVETIYSAYHQVRCLLSHYWQKSSGDNLQCLPSSPLSTISLLTEVQWRQFTVLTIKSAVYYLTIDRSPVETIYSAYHQVRCVVGPVINHAYD